MLHLKILRRNENNDNLHFQRSTLSKERIIALYLEGVINRQDYLEAKRDAQNRFSLDQLSKATSR